MMSSFFIIFLDVLNHKTTSQSPWEGVHLCGVCVHVAFVRSLVIKGWRTFYFSIFFHCLGQFNYLILEKNRRDIYRKRLGLNSSDSIVKFLYWVLFVPPEECFTIKHKTHCWPLERSKLASGLVWPSQAICLDLLIYLSQRVKFHNYDPMKESCFPPFSS